MAGETASQATAQSPARETPPPLPFAPGSAAARPRAGNRPAPFPPPAHTADIDKLASQTGQAQAAGAAVMGGAATAGASVRESNLMRREQALLDKERDLIERERRVAALLREPNWPFKSCWAVTYINTNEDIPEAHQGTVKKFYTTMLLTWVALIYNWITIFAVKVDADGSSSSMLWSAVYVIFGLPGSFFWFKSGIYNACRDIKGGSSTRWGTFFLTFFLHTGFSIVMCTGIPKTAGAGFWTFLDIIDDHKSVGIMTLVSAVVWLIVSVASVTLMKRAHSIWRGFGGAEQAQQDLAKEAIRRQVV